MCTPRPTLVKSMHVSGGPNANKGRSKTKFTSSASFELTDHAHVEMLGVRYKSVSFHVQRLVIQDLGVNPNYYTFTLILLIKIVLCSQFHKLSSQTLSFSI